MTVMLETVLTWLLWTSLGWAALAFGIALWFRIWIPQTAAVRHTALAAAVLAGTLAGLLPKWGHGVIPTSPSSVEMTRRSEVPQVRDTELNAVNPTHPAEIAGDVVQPPVVVPRHSQNDEPDPFSSWNRAALSRTLFAVAWLAGALVAGVRLLRAARVTLRWRHEAQPLSEQEHAVFATVCRELRVQRTTQAGAHDEPASPLVLCGWTPLVLVPGDWSTWDETSRRAAWVHELAHVRRRDDWWRMLSEVLRVIFWFHPGIRWLLSRREHEAELLSDEAAVAAGCPPQELAQVLLDACRRPHSVVWSAPGGTFFSRRTMKVRISRLLEAPSAEALCRPAPRGLRVLAFAGIALLALAGSMRWMTAAKEAIAASPDDHTHLEGRPAEEPPPPEVIVPVADQPKSPVESRKPEPEPISERPNYVKVVGQLLDAETGKPIEKASWEWGMADPGNPAQVAWGHSKKWGGAHPEGKFEELVHFTPDGRFDRLRVYAGGYETTIVVDELPDPRPLQVERIVRLKRGPTVTGTLRDHTGQLVANGVVFFIPDGHRSNIVEGMSGADAHGLPTESRDGAVAEVHTDTEGRFALSTGRAGILAASSDTVDLWPFPLPEDGHADLRMPKPAYLVIDLAYWYLDEFTKKDKRAFSPDSEDPNQCWIQVDRPGELKGLWKGLDYRRQMFVFARDPRGKLSRGVNVGQVIEGASDKPIPEAGHNRNLSTKIRIALPPGNYRVQRLRAGPFAPVDEQNLELSAGMDSTLDWARGEGAAVRGKVAWPANTLFVRQPGEAPRKLDWTVPDLATVTIATAEGQTMEAAAIQTDGSFFVATHLEPGTYKATATVFLPERDFRGGWRFPDCRATQDLVIPEPPRVPTGSPPVNIDLHLEDQGGRFVSR